MATFASRRPGAGQPRVVPLATPALPRISQLSHASDLRIVRFSAKLPSIDAASVRGRTFNFQQCLQTALSPLNAVCARLLAKPPQWNRGSPVLTDPSGCTVVNCDVALDPSAMTYFSNMLDARSSLSSPGPESGSPPLTWTAKFAEGDVSEGAFVKPRSLTLISRGWPAGVTAEDVLAQLAAALPDLQVQRVEQYANPRMSQPWKHADRWILHLGAGAQFPNECLRFELPLLHTPPLPPATLALYVEPFDVDGYVAKHQHRERSASTAAAAARLGREAARAAAGAGPSGPTTSQHLPGRLGVVHDRLEREGRFSVLAGSGDGPSPAAAAPPPSPLSAEAFPPLRSGGTASTPPPQPQQQLPLASSAQEPQPQPQQQHQQQPQATASQDAPQPQQPGAPLPQTQPLQPLPQQPLRQDQLPGPAAELPPPELQIPQQQLPQQQLQQQQQPAAAPPSPQAPDPALPATQPLAPPAPELLAGAPAATGPPPDTAAPDVEAQQGGAAASPLGCNRTDAPGVAAASLPPAAGDARAAGGGSPARGRDAPDTAMAGGGSAPNSQASSRSPSPPPRRQRLNQEDPGASPVMLSAPPDDLLPSGGNPDDMRDD